MMILDVQMDIAESKDGIVPDKRWPDRGSLKIKDLCVRYAHDLPDVLQSVSFDVEVSRPDSIDVRVAPDAHSLVCVSA